MAIIVGKTARSKSEVIFLATYFLKQNLPGGTQLLNSAKNSGDITILQEWVDDYLETDHPLEKNGRSQVWKKAQAVLRSHRAKGNFSAVMIHAKTHEMLEDLILGGFAANKAEAITKLVKAQQNKQ